MWPTRTQTTGRVPMSKSDQRSVNRVLPQLPTRRGILKALMRKDLQQAVGEAALKKMQEKADKVIAKSQAKGCPHQVAQRIQVPHPKYGDRVPHFETIYTVDPDCGCGVK